MPMSMAQPTFCEKYSQKLPPNGIEGLDGTKTINVSTPLVLSILKYKVDTLETPTSTLALAKGKWREYSYT